MRDWKRAGLAGALASLCLVGGGCSPSDTTGPSDEDIPPSVILISLDTLRYDHCGFNGYERDTTPFLDRLAAQSIVFDRAYTTMSWTLIAHMSMLTGLYPTQHGVMEAELALSPEFPTLAERLEAIGYVNLGVHFPGWLDPRFGFGRGFDHYSSADDAEKAEREVETALRQVREGWPYFLFIHLFDVHSGQLHLPGSTIYDPPAPFDSIWVEDAKERLAGIDGLAWWEGTPEPSPEQHEAVVALYDGGIRYVDSVLERWFTEWEDRGLLDNTLVIITSDHGEGLMQRIPRYGGHGNLNEEGLRVPLLVRLPKNLRAGERVDRLSSLVDIVPTVLDVLGLEEDERLPGFSLVGEGRENDDWVFAARSRARAAVSSDRKILYRDRRPQILYRLDEDPEETSPIAPAAGAKEFFAKVGPMLDGALARLNGFYRPDPARRIDEMDESAKQQLKGLGYGGEVGR